MKRHHAMIIFTSGAFFFGLNPLFLNLAYDAGWSLNELNVVQVTIAFIVLWMIGGITIKKHLQVWKRLSLKTVLFLMIAGSFTGLTSVLYYASMQYLPASISIVLLFQFIWIGVLFEWILYRQKPSGQTMVTVILTLIGVLFAADVFHGGLSSINWIGVLFGLGAAFSYSIFIIVSGRLAADIPATIRSPIMITGAALLSYLIFPPHQAINASMFADVSIWVYAGGLALCGLILPPLLFAIATPHLPASLATILGAIELPVSVMVAYIGLGEYIANSRWFGVALILAAIVIGEMRGFLQGVFRRERYVN